MKRELLKNVMVLPYASGSVVDREGFLSAVLGVSAVAAGDLKVTVTHSDTADGTFTDVTDKVLFIDNLDEATGLKVNGVANFDIDLVGCKQFVKFTLSGAAAATGSGETAKTASCAVVLGDPYTQPV